MNKRTLNHFAALIGAAFLAAPAFGQPSTAADAIYVGGDIVTMNDKAPSAKALAVKDGRILAVGDRAVLESNHKGAKTKVVNLAGKTLLPGFLDAHSHYISSLTVANQANALRAARGTGEGRGQHRRRAEEVRRRQQDPEGRGDTGLRLRRERHAARAAAEPRRSRRCVS